MKQMDKSDIQVSYSILTHNETNSLRKLLEQIQAHKSMWDDIHIIDDFSDNEETKKILEWAKSDLKANIHQRKLDGDFSAQKNFANDVCKNEYIFNIDADEYISDFFLKNFKEILFYNRNIEMFQLSRINKIEGISMDHINKWGWMITSIPTEMETKIVPMNSSEYELLKIYNLIINYDEKTNECKFLTPIINYPDYQYRIYKNKPQIKWQGKVHERIIGYTKYSKFPSEKNFSILHYKTIDKQEKQNDLYQKIFQNK